MIESNDVLAWLQNWQFYVRSKDYGSAMHLFREDVFSFGTVAISASGLKDLVFFQWKVVWENSKNFTFNMDSIRFFYSKDYSLVIVAVQWFGQGLDQSSGQFSERSGRSSIVLEKQGEKLVCTHTHFSIDPISERKFWGTD